MESNSSSYINEIEALEDMRDRLINEVHDLDNQIDDLIDENSNLQYSLTTSQVELDKYKGAIENLCQYFRSGNDVEIDRVTISKNSFETIIGHTVYGE